MTARKSTCLLCGQEYEVCKLCPRVKEFTPWRIDFDTPRHFQIYNVVQDLRNETLTNLEAKDVLDHLSVTPEEVATFVPSVRATLEPVVGSVKPKKAIVPKEEKTVEEAPKQPQKETGKPSVFKGRNRK